MTPSDYFAIEAAITQRVTTLWASPLQSIAELVYAGKYDDAIEVALSIDLSTLKIKDYVIAVLKSAAAYGAMMAESVPHFLNDPIFGIVATNFMESLQYTTSVAIQDSAIKAINDLRTDPAKFDDEETKEAVKKIQKALTKDRFVKDFVSYADGSDQHLRLIASLHTHRLSTWGFTAEAEYAKIDTYTLVAVLDSKTSNYCRNVANGKQFRVEAARSKILEVLSSPMESMKTVQPWPKQTKAALAAYAALTPEELTDLGLHIGPFHPECRTMCVLTNSTLAKVSPTVISTTLLPNIPDKQQPIPVTPSLFSREDAMALGLNLTLKTITAWNNNLITSPLETLAALTGKSTISLADTGLGSLKQKHRVGKGKSLTLHFEETLESKAVNKPVLAYSYNINAVDSALKINYLDITDHPKPYQQMSKLLNGALMVAEANALSTLTVSVQGEMAWLMALFGFQTKNIIKLRAALTKSLEAIVTINPLVIGAADLEALRVIINSPKLGSVGMQAVAKYPLKIGAKPIGQLLFQTAKMDANFDLVDTKMLSLLTGYLGAVE